MLLTPRQAAQRLSVSPRTVYLWLEQGRLEHVRLSERVTRIPEAAVDEMVSRGLVAASNGAVIAQETHAVYCSRCGAAVSADKDYARELRGVVEQHRTQIIDVVSAHRASNPRLFGSVARGDAGARSDIDILVDLEEHASYLDLGRIQVEIEAILGHRVDVVPSRTLKPAIRENIMAEVVPI